MKKRILLLPGFIEDAFIFDEIKSSFSEYELVFVDYRKTLDDCNLSEIDVWSFTKKLIQNYAIQKTDIVIGHSMGGYFSLVIREQIDTEICMIASFSDPKKVRRVSQNRFLTVLVAQTGFIKSQFIERMMIKPCIGKYFEDINTRVVSNMHTFSNSQLAKMVKLSFGEKIKSTKKNPLRIHATNDTIVRPPDEAFYEVKLGHFCLFLEPKEVLKPIDIWLNEIK